MDKSAKVSDKEREIFQPRRSLVRSPNAEERKRKHSATSRLQFVTPEDADASIRELDLSDDLEDRIEKRKKENTPEKQSTSLNVNKPETEIDKNTESQSKTQVAPMDSTEMESVQRINKDTEANSQTNRVTEIRILETMDTHELLHRVRKNGSEVLEIINREKGGKIIFNKPEKKIVRQNIDDTADIMTVFALRLGRMETEIMNKNKTSTAKENNDLKDLYNEIKKMRKEFAVINQDKQETSALRSEIMELKGQMTELRAEFKNSKTDIIARKGYRSAWEENNSSTPNQRVEQRIDYNADITNINNPVDNPEDMETEQRDNNMEKRDTNKRMQEVERTYASIAGGTREANPGKVWKTPEKPESERLEVTVKVANVVKATEAIQAVKNILKPHKEEIGPIKNTIPLTDGRIVMLFNNKDQKQKVTDTITASNQDIQVKEKGTAKPKLMITGICKGYEEAEILEMLLQENEDLDNMYGNRLINETRIVYRRTCRNPTKENIFIETSLEIFKHLVKKAEVFLDMGVSRVQEIFGVTQCFNCNKFGHVAKYCNAAETCQYCGENHKGRDCTANELDCLNCRAIRIPKQNRKHSARDKDCPIMIRRENILRRNTQYHEETQAKDTTQAGGTEHTQYT